MLRKRAKCVSVALFFVVSFFIVPALAEADVGLYIKPIKVSETISPGETRDGVIELQNKSDGPARVEMSIEDFIPTGGYSYQFVGRAEGVTTVRDWIKFDFASTTIIMDAEQRIEIPYTITAPPDAEPGGHFGVLFFKAKKIDDTGNLRVGTRVGTLIYVTVPGNYLQKGEILKFAAPRFVKEGPVDFQIDFQNTGTVHFEPKGAINITNIFGRKSGEVPIGGRVVLPGNVTSLSGKWDPGRLILGRYTAEINILDGEGNKLTANTVDFYAFPIVVAIIYLVAIILVFALLWLMKKRVSFSISFKKPESGDKKSKKDKKEKNNKNTK